LEDERINNGENPAENSIPSDKETGAAQDAALREENKTQEQDKAADGQSSEKGPGDAAPQTGAENANERDDFPKASYMNNYKSVPEGGPVFKENAEKGGDKSSRSKGKSKIVFTALVLVLGILLSAGMGAGTAVLLLKSGDSFTSGGRVSVVVSEADNLSAGTITEVSEAVIDTVVEITTETVTTSTYLGQYVKSGAGSGVIISTDGYILTNYHVIQGATTIGVRVRTTDRSGVKESVSFKNYPATVAGSDEESDVALLKIDAQELTAAVIGDSDSLRIGQQVVAIGNPLGELGGTVTDGIISALDREIEVGGATMTLLQTNAAVNPGNSGGGLFDLSGRLVGIVNAKSSGDSIEGLGFAIPIKEGWGVAKELLENGYVRGRVSLGIEVREITAINAALYYQGYTTPGIYVTDPGKNTNLEAMDRIVALEGAEVASTADVKKILQGHAVGDELTMTVVRNGRYTEVKVTCFEKVPAGVEKNFETGN